MRASLTLLALAAAGAALAAPALAAEGDLTRVSVADDGSQSATGGTRTAVSADGRYVLFLSTTQLTATPTGGKRQLYLRDRVDGRTRIVSVNAAGQAADQDVVEGDSFNPFIDVSGDGRYAVFVSTAQNLVSPDANGAKADVFRKDLVTGAIEVVSLTPAGAQGDESVPGDPSISFDGTRIAFTTGTARAYVAGDVSNASEVVVRDTLARTTVLAARSTAGVQANDFAERPSISADGRFVAFEAGPMTDNLFLNDANATNDVVVHDLVTGTTVPGAVAVDGTVPGGGIPDISGDGRVVAFSTSAKLDPGNDPNNEGDVYARDLVAGTTTLVSARNGLTTASAAGSSAQAAVSADGGRVAFRSAAQDLVAADANNATEDVYLRRIGPRSVVRVSADAAGGQTASGSESTALSGDGRWSAFVTAGALVGGGDTNNADDVHLKELAAGDDTTAPDVTWEASISGARVRAAGSVAADASGIGKLTVNGTVVRVAPNGAFRADVPVTGARTTVTVTVVDGAGNSRQQRLTVARRAPRVTGLSARVIDGRVVVRLRILPAARVAARVQRRVVVRPRGVRFVNAGKPVVRRFARGTRTLRLAAPRKRGVYRVRLVVTGLGVSRAVTVPFRIR